MKFNNPRIWYWIAGLLLLPAFLINLNLITLNDDEAIRTLVAMEMELSGNYIVPTLNGELYRAKPPLFNWILIQSFRLFGGVSEFAARIPNILFLGAFGFIIFHYSKKQLSKEYSVLSALLFVTCGRILFWDSMLAYIDILYSMITYTSFMLIYHEFKKERFWRLFIFSYILCSLGFLLKGFPTLAFQGITLLTYFIYRRSWKKLFSLPHFVGIGIFVAIVGSYYLAYFNQADGWTTVAGLLDQSTRRTALHEQYDYLQFFQHLITYPFENIYHFLPWSIMAIYLLSSKSAKLISNQPFLVFCSLTFLANIVIYWVSVEVYPRYILMLIPLVFSIFLYLHQIHYRKNSYLYKIYFRTHQFLLIGIILTCLIALRQTMHIDIPYRYIKMFSGIIALSVIFYFFTKYRNVRLITFVCAILVLRILFNWFVIPERHQTSKPLVCKEQAIALGKEYQDIPINIYRFSNIDLTSSVYITRERNKITPRSLKIQNPGVTILDTAKYEIPLDTDVVGKICVRGGSQTLFLIQAKD